MHLDSQPIQAILFDRDGVLVDMDWKGINRALVSKLPFPPNELENRWKVWVQTFPPTDAEAERNTIRAFVHALSDEVTDAAAREALRAFDYTQFVTIFPETSAALAFAKAQGLRVGVLSNNSILMSSRGLLSIAGLSDFVDDVLTAQMLGVSKPAPRAYQLAAESLGVTPEACLFFDNNAEWVVAARALGFRAYHVDRTRETHDLHAGVVCDLLALREILA